MWDWGPRTHSQITTHKMQKKYKFCLDTGKLLALCVCTFLLFSTLISDNSFSIYNFTVKTVWYSNSQCGSIRWCYKSLPKSTQANIMKSWSIRLWYWFSMVWYCVPYRWIFSFICGINWSELPHLTMKYSNIDLLLFFFLTKYPLIHKRICIICTKFVHFLEFCVN